MSGLTCEGRKSHTRGRVNDLTDGKGAMCLLVILREIVPEWPLVIAANRDERYDRPGEPPQPLCGAPRVFGGRDSVAGGTWLAVNQWGMVVAVTNRPRSRPAQGIPRSRGLLALDAARQKSPIAVADLLGGALAEHEYDGFNLFCSTLAEGRLFYFDGVLREKPLHRGVFVIATGEANDPASPKVQRALAWLTTERERPMDQWVRRLEMLLRDHAGANPQSPAPDALCLHGESAGTVSSSILGLHANNPTLHFFRHCQGRPCENPFQIAQWPDRFFEAP